MGSPGAQHSVAPIVAALIEDIVDEARHQAADSATRRLESALVLMLDECANIAPLGDLPKLVAELGGLGITTAVILQSVASARNIWGEAGERALRDLANITLVWGGQKDIAFLEEISRWPVSTTSWSRPPRSVRAEGSARGRHVACRCCPSKTSPTCHPITPVSCPLTFGHGSPTLGHGGWTASSKHSPRVPERPLLEE